ncbi:MAG: hypothetical protein ACRCS9_08295, partial [Hyphomicrobium sp.]
MVNATGIASADELVMPFTCTSASGDVRLTPGPEVRYAILGARDEQPFVSCAGSSANANSNSNASACTTSMVYRFQITCGGVAAPWWKVAAAAREHGIAVPDGMPQGFGPIAALKGRIILPALARFAPVNGAVSMEALSPDSVAPASGDESGDDARGNETALWHTVVKSEMRAEAGVGALRVGGALMLVLAMIFGTSMLAAGYGRHARLAAADMSAGGREWLRRTQAAAEPFVASMLQTMSRLGSAVGLSALFGRHALDAADVGAIAIVQARLAETALAVAALPSELLLRDVLSSEINRVADRVAVMTRDAERIAVDRLKLMIRANLREIERIAKIAASAVPQADGG